MRDHIAAARGYWDEARERSQFLEQLQLQHTQVVESEGASVGFFMAFDLGEDFELHTLCIAPEHQRKGLGTAITRQLMDEAHTRKQSIVLSVLKVNTAARSFYNRLGFVVTEESAHHYRMRLVS